MFVAPIDDIGFCDVGGRGLTTIWVEFDDLKPEVKAESGVDDDILAVDVDDLTNASNLFC